MKVYRIINKLDGKTYIGQTTFTIEKRFKEHCRNKKSSMPICRAIQKYGKNNFSIIELGNYSDIYQLNDAEEYFIEFYNCRAPNGYNLLSGGGNQKHHPDTCIAISNAQKGRHYSIDTEFKKGHVVSKKIKTAISVANKGKRNSPNTQFKKGTVPWNKGLTGIKYSKRVGA